jgi:pilus assembly protein CpaB
VISSKRITTALLIAFVLSGGFTYLLSHRMDRQAAAQRSHTLDYVASARIIQSGEVLKQSDLRMISWPASSPLHGALARMEDAVGRSALYPLDPGQPLLDRQITPPGVGPGLASKIPDGMRAIALRSDEVVGVAGFLTPGSHLDVLVTYHAEKSTEMMTAIVLQNAEVVAAGHQVEPDPEGKSATTTVVTLLLSPQESERAVLASSQGSIHFILRNSADKSKTDSSPLSLSQLVSGSLQSGHQGQPPAAPAAYIRRSGGPLLQVSEAKIETVLGEQGNESKSGERTQQ